MPGLAALVANYWPVGWSIGAAPDIRGASFFNFGIALYLTVLLRARRPAATPSGDIQSPRSEDAAARAAPITVDAKALWARMGSDAARTSSPGRRWLGSVGWLLPMFLIVGLGLLAAPRQSAATITVIPPTAAPSPYDGEWAGSGLSVDGRNVRLSFTVRGGSLGSIRYAFPGENGTNCSTFDFAMQAASQRPQIADSALVVTLGNNLALAMAFTSDRVVSGHMTINWQHRFENCDGRYEVEWSAARQ